MYCEKEESWWMDAVNEAIPYHATNGGCISKHLQRPKGRIITVFLKRR